MADLLLSLNPNTKVPHLAEYFGPWAIREIEGMALAQIAGSLDLDTHLRTVGAATVREASAGQGEPYEIQDGIAVIPLAGPLMKHVSSFTQGTSTIAARQQIRHAADNPDVAAIALLIESPGGTVAGTQDLGDDIAKANKQKPVYAQINDIGASAAYWAAAQAGKIFANKTAYVGAIGNFIVVQDFSKAAKQDGVQVHVVRFGEFKGMGTPGTEITAEQLAEIQRGVDATGKLFVEAVALGRKNLSLSAIQKLADGRCHLAAQAKELGLIDEVQSFDETLSQLVDAGRFDQSGRAPTQLRKVSASSLSFRRFSPMADVQTAPPQVAQLAPPPPAAATLAELKEACPEADSGFLLEQLERNATLDKARNAYTAKLRQQLNAQKAELEKLRAMDDDECNDDADDDDDEDDEDDEAKGKSKGKAKGKAKSKSKAAVRPGVEPVSRSAPPARETHFASAREEYRAEIQKRTEKGMPKAEAAKAVIHSNPELHRAMVEEANAKRPGPLAGFLTRFDN